VPDPDPVTPATAPTDDTDDLAVVIRALLVRADERRKAAGNRAEPAAAREGIVALLDRARALIPELPDEQQRIELSAAVSRRFDDSDLDVLRPMLAPSVDVAPAPTVVDDPTRVPPGQHLTAGFPVLHVGQAPDWGPADVRLVVTGLVDERLVLDLDALQGFEPVELTRDFHCVTRWSRLDNRWTGVRARDVLARAGVRAGATHAVVSGHPAYSTNLTLEVLAADDVLFAWAHDGRPLPPIHGGPLRLVVPRSYGWKSVKWVTEVRLLDHDVRGYWEERGYHDVGDPWSEQRFQGD
jgi:DMSO/TMAO reductase YedYZ molybdopterin-dependent catalytic subunit